RVGQQVADRTLETRGEVRDIDVVVVARQPAVRGPDVDAPGATVVAQDFPDGDREPCQLSVGAPTHPEALRGRTPISPAGSRGKNRPTLEAAVAWPACCGALFLFRLFQGTAPLGGYSAQGWGLRASGRALGRANAGTPESLDGATADHFTVQGRAPV